MKKTMHALVLTFTLLFLGVGCGGNGGSGSQVPAADQPGQQNSDSVASNFDSQSANTATVGYLQFPLNIVGYLKGVKTCNDWADRAQTLSTALNGSGGASGLVVGDCKDDNAQAIVTAELRYEVTFQDYEVSALDNSTLVVNGKHTMLLKAERVGNKYDFHADTFESNLIIDGKIYDLKNASILIPQEDFSKPQFSGTVTIEGHTCTLSADGQTCQF